MKHRDWSTSKVLFFIGLGLLFISGLAQLVSVSDLRWTYCYDSYAYQVSQGDNQCNFLISLFSPAVFLMILSVVFHFLKFHKMKIKQKVLLISFLYVVVASALVGVSYICNNGSWCEIRGDSTPWMLVLSFFPLFCTFIFSLITYYMREEMFFAWWNFARWMVPIIVVLTIPLLLTDDGGGMFSEMVLTTGMSLLYLTFVPVSLFKIIWGYARVKDRDNGEVD